METEVISRMSSSFSAERQGGIAQFLSRDGRHFAGHADDGETIGPVRGHTDIENRIPQIKRVRQFLSQGQDRAGGS